MTSIGPTPIAERLRGIARVASNAANEHDDNDCRVYFLADLEELDWAQTDDRWRAAMELLRFDRTDIEVDPIGRELNALLIQIATQAGDMILTRGEPSGAKDVQKMACQAREATDRLAAIVYATTAVHALGSAAA